MAEAVTFTQLQRSLQSGKTLPVYLVMGEEGYYADELCKTFEALLAPEDRDFNLTILYAPQVDPATVVDAAQRYPMMADKQVVLVKEAQAVNANWLNALAPYALTPTPTTVLAIVCRGGSPSCAELKKAVTKGGGVVFESKKLRDYQVAPTIKQFVADRGLTVDDKALGMLQEFVGADLARLYNEIEKLTMVLGRGAMITPEAVERNIGVSKDYNNFEYIAALSCRDSLKAFKCVDYFRRNPKNNPTVVTASMLFNFFSNLLVALYTPDKSERSLMAALGFKWAGQLKDINAGMRNYNAWHLLTIIDALRRFDAASKGIGSRADQYDLLHDLTFTILTAGVK